MKTSIKYALRSKKTGLYVEIRQKLNPKDRYACCEVSHYAYLPRRYSAYEKIQSYTSIWSLDSTDELLKAITEETAYYNAESPLFPVIEFDFHEDELEFIRIKITEEIEVVKI